MQRAYRKRPGVFHFPYIYTRSHGLESPCSVVGVPVMAIENGKVVEKSMRAEEKESYSWVVDMKKLLEGTDPCILRFKKPSIYIVPSK